MLRAFQTFHLKQSMSTFLWGRMKSKETVKIFSIHPLGTTNVCTQFRVNQNVIQW